MKYRMLSILLGAMVMAASIPVMAETEALEELEGIVVLDDEDELSVISMAEDMGTEYDEWDDEELFALEDEEGNIMWEEDDIDDLVGVDYTPYEEIVNKYVQAQTEKWDIEKLIEEKMSMLAYYCYQDREDEVMGFLPFDLNFDGIEELLIGSLTGEEENDKMILDAYTLKDGKAEKLFESSERNRYYFMYDEAGSRMIANEGSSSAAKSGWHYYIFNGEEMEVMQAIIYDSETSPDAPWFQAYDDDWDVTNDEPVDEAYATEIIKAHEEQCIGTGYFYASQGFFIPDQEYEYEDEWGDYQSFEELIADLPAGYGYAYADLKGNGEQYLILTDATYACEESENASETVMVYMMGSQGTMNIGNCYSYGTAYPIRLKDGIFYSGGNHDMEASVLSKENGYVMCLYYISEYFDEDGTPHYFGFTRSENSIEEEAREIAEDSGEEFQKAIEEYLAAPVLEFTVVE